MSVEDAKLFATDQEVRWCPGCGDYAILKAMRQSLADGGAKPHKTVFVSGIGCAARFPYYMNTYGMHTIHGRAPAFATGLKSARPDLEVWVVTGDGDGMSIGGNHLLHVLRRNVDVQILMCNNQIYGLTKGQASPTSLQGLRTPSSPRGVVTQPVDPCRFALAAGGTFVARSVDVHQKRLQETFAAARAHCGTSFVEVLQNCPIYNDGAFSQLTDRNSSADHCLYLEHGKPLIYGDNRQHGLRLKHGSLRVETVEFEPDSPPSELLVHDETDPTLAALLAPLGPPDFPVALGILHRIEAAIHPSAKTLPTDAEGRRGDPFDEIASKVRQARIWRVE